MDANNNPLEKFKATTQITIQKPSTENKSTETNEKAKDISQLFYTGRPFFEASFWLWTPKEIHLLDGLSHSRKRSVTQFQIANLWSTKRKKSFETSEQLSELTPLTIASEISQTFWFENRNSVICEKLQFFFNEVLQSASRQTLSRPSDKNLARVTS